MKKIVVATCLLMLATLARCYGFDSGYYSNASHEFKEIDGIVSASRRCEVGKRLLFCYGKNSFLCPEHALDGSRLSREKVKHLLEAETQKAILVIWFPDNGPILKPFVLAPRKEFYPTYIARMREATRDITPFVESLGYDRIVMLTHSANKLGYYVIQDRTRSRGHQSRLNSNVSETKLIDF